MIMRGAMETLEISRTVTRHSRRYREKDLLSPTSVFHPCGRSFWKKELRGIGGGDRSSDFLEIVGTLSYDSLYLFRVFCGLVSNLIDVIPLRKRLSPGLCVFFFLHYFSGGVEFSSFGKSGRSRGLIEFKLEGFL